MATPAKVLEQVRWRDRGLCRYCLTAEANCGQPLHIDHIIPRHADGPSTTENLCLACFSCNVHKAGKRSAIDPVTEQQTALFHPMQQKWDEHFEWDASRTKIIGSTVCGRATVVALRMNHPIIVQARQRWVSAGWHPPNT